ncbi:MAG: MBG domain-containing protein [Bacteroidales bacterium]
MHWSAIDEFSGTLAREMFEDVGIYTVVQGTLTAGTNYDLTVEPGTFSINPALITLNANNQNKTYGGMDPELTYQITSGSLFGNDSFTGSLSRMAGEDVGNYPILLGDLSAGGNYFITYIEGIFSINPAVLTVSIDPEIQFIFEDQPLPAINYNIAGFVNGETQSVLNSLNYSVSPNYNNQPGTYTITPVATASNYTMTYISGLLYVNPDGPGTKHIIPKVICVDPLPAGSAFGFLARFEYTNNNNSDVFIPVGEDNFFTSTGAYDAINQPELFLAGGGYFEVPFDGSDLTWTVASYNHKGQKAAQGSSASSSSPSCSKTSEVEDDLAFTNYENEIKAYPNPATDKVSIMLTEALSTVTSDDIRVFDIMGSVCKVKAITAANGLVQIDLSGMNSGLYFIYIGNNETKEMVRVIKH